MSNYDDYCAGCITGGRAYAYCKCTCANPDCYRLQPTIKKEGPMSSNNCWDIAEAVIGVSRRVLLKGKPGTGKTHAATHLALEDGVPVYSLTLTEETPMAEIRGHFVTKGGEFVWMDGPAVRAWREGGRLVLNEIDHASDDVLTFMYAIMDDPDYATVTLPTGDTVVPADGFHLIATMNGELHDLPDALQDRLPVSIEINELNPSALDALPEDLRDPAKNTTLLSNAERSLSIRAWMEYAALRDTIDKRVAAEAIFGDNAADAILALQVAETASIPHDMEGVEITENDRVALVGCNRVWGWIEDRRSAGYGTPTLSEIRNELKYVLPATDITVEQLENGTEWDTINFTITLTDGAHTFVGQQLERMLNG